MEKFILSIQSSPIAISSHKFVILTQFSYELL
nr:MAG TPA: hypothetical protein [Caudoviricetes sp.]DAL56473.1 MAG TPA_asm: hypothetical protein [Caudoviricetes sp.]DAL61290.1 MAG TPA_asm: hypothetical protein [Bacteriophage sp.]